MSNNYDNGFRVRAITTTRGWPTASIHLAERRTKSADLIGMFLAGGSAGTTSCSYSAQYSCGRVDLRCHRTEHSLEASDWIEARGSPSPNLQPGCRSGRCWPKH